MRRYILTTIAALTAVAAMAVEKKSFTFSGHLTDVADTLIAYAYSFDGVSRDQLPAIVARDGHFSFTTQLSEPMRLQFYIPPTQQRKRGNRMLSIGYIIAVPGNTVHLEGSIDNFTTTGSQLYCDYQQVLDIDHEVSRKITAAVASRQQEMRDPARRKAAQAEIDKMVQGFQAEKEARLKAFIRDNGDNDAAVFALTSVNVDAVPEAVKILSDKVKNGQMQPLVKWMEGRYASKVAQDEAKKNLTKGKMAPDFTLNDIKGKPFTLSSLRGKYVVLDFWGSWCGWCIKGMPDMKKYYEKYAGKFEIVGIDCNDTDQKWKAAVTEHQLPWIHVKHEKNSGVVEAYAVTGYPTKYIINPDGTIYKAIVGEDPQFYKDLDTLLGDKR